MVTNGNLEGVISGFTHGRVPRAVRERQLLELAEELFAERGYEGASMDELARRAGVTKPVIYGVVGPKDELFARCFQRAGDELADAMADAAAAHVGDLAAMLRASALAFLHFIEHHRRAWAVLSALGAGGRTEAHLRRIRTERAERVAAQLAAGDPDIDAARARGVAYLLNGAFEALAHWRLAQPEVDDATAADWLVAFVVPGLEQLLYPPPEARR
jgi:AcrR family transcriptional regulator